MRGCLIKVESLFNKRWGIVNKGWDHALTNEQREAKEKHTTRIKRAIKAEDGTTQEIVKEQEDTLWKTLDGIEICFY